MDGTCAEESSVQDDWCDGRRGQVVGESRVGESIVGEDETVDDGGDGCFDGRVDGVGSI